MDLEHPPHHEGGIPPLACTVTGEGVAGIATIQISGVAAAEAVGRIFRGKRKIEPSGNIYYGSIVHPATGEILDDVVIGCYPPHQSPTGDILAEIHCHGGKATVAAISRLLRDIGVEFHTQQEWVDRIQQGGIERAALRHFLGARTDVAARVFWYQRQGCLRSALQQIFNLAPEKPELGLALALQLAQTAATGLALAVPSRIVIAGATNVGKSTLLNRILRRERVIVDAQPGTTRDAVSDYTAIRGVPFTITDTAGLRESADPIERLGMASARRAIAGADLIIWMYDVGRPPTEMPSPPEKKTVLVLNKIDSCPNYLDEYLRRCPRGILLSALTGEGVGRLEDALVAGICPPDAPSPVIFEKSQAEILECAIRSLEERQILEARQHLARLLE